MGTFKHHVVVCSSSAACERRVGFSGGAPAFKKVCKDLEPGHGAASQPSNTFPVSLVDPASSYGASGWLEFELEGTFKGAIFQVRNADGQAVGAFCDYSLDTDNFQFVEDCARFNLAGQAIPKKATLTHKGASTKNGAKFYWKSGGNDHGTVTLWGSVAEHYSSVWIMQEIGSFSY